MKKRTLLGLAVGAAAGVGIYKYLQNKKALESEDYDLDDFDTDDLEDAAEDAADAAEEKVESLAEELKDAAESDE